MEGPTIISLKEAARRLDRNPRDVRILVDYLAIPTTPVGTSDAIDGRGLRRLVAAFAVVDRNRKLRARVPLKAG